MEFVKVDAWPRTERGKRPNAQLRREGKTPAIAYGKGRTSRALAVSPSAFLQALRGPWGRNAVLQISVNQETPFPALVADYSYHPVTRDLLHVDFLHIDLDSPVDVDVPLVTSGKPAGVVEGGTLRQIFRTLPIRCLPALIPQNLEYDVTAMAINDVAKVGDLKLPEGIQVRLPVEQTVIAVDAAVAEPEAEVVPGAEGAEAAPAAEAATDAAKGKAEPAKGKAEPAKGK